MKKIILAALISSSAFAIGNPADVPSDFPTDSGWAKFRVSTACDMSFPKSFTGSIENTSEGKVFSVMNENGDEVAAAIKTGLFSAIECL